MAFTDPQTVTINAVAQTLPRTGITDSVGSFSKDDGNVQLVVSQGGNLKRNRRAVRLNHKKVAPDPLFPANNVPFSMSVTLVVDVPSTGYSLAEQKQIVDALTAYLSASSGARVTQLLGGEL